MIKRFLALGCMVFALVTLSACGSDPKPVTITIEPVGNTMAYATTAFTVKAGQSVTLVMKNTATMDAMKHNIVVLNQGTNTQAIGQAALSAPDYVPDNPAILAATPLADAGQQTEITFTAPKKKGAYPYICTFPGHYMMMKGIMTVQ